MSIYVQTSVPSLPLPPKNTHGKAITMHSLIIQTKHLTNGETTIQEHTDAFLFKWCFTELGLVTFNRCTFTTLHTDGERHKLRIFPEVLRSEDVGLFQWAAVIAVTLKIFSLSREKAKKVIAPSQTHQSSHCAPPPLFQGKKLTFSQRLSHALVRSKTQQEQFQWDNERDRQGQPRRSCLAVVFQVARANWRSQQWLSEEAEKFPNPRPPEYLGTAWPDKPKSLVAIWTTKLEEKCHSGEPGLLPTNSAPTISLEKFWLVEGIVFRNLKRDTCFLLLS